MALFALTRGEWQFACICVTGALVFDTLDGIIARSLGVQGDFGTQLDSLSDVISFGAVPALMIYLSTPIPGSWFHPALLFMAAGAWRLARFNIDPAQKSVFKGLPIPAAAMGVIGMCWAIHVQHQNLAPNYILTIGLGYALLMTSTLPLFKPNFQNPPPYLIIFILLGIGLCIYWPSGFAICVLIAAYILLSLLVQRKIFSSTSSENH